MEYGLLISSSLFAIVIQRALLAPTGVEQFEPDQQPDLFEGDIDGIDPAVVSIESLQTQSNGIRDEEFRWKDGVIPFEISSTYDAEKRKLILEAMEGFHQQTCIKFRDRVASDQDYISIISSHGCSSVVGRSKGRQDVQLELTGCMIKGKIQHELMHAVGFFHEQSRTDRDEYVELNLNNIGEVTLEKDFAKYTDKTITAFDQPYDYGSVMHYGKDYFSLKKGNWTIRPKPPHENEEIGQRKQLSRIDVIKINKMYKCPPKETVTSPPVPSLPKDLLPNITKSQCSTFQTVAEDDTAYAIAKIQGISVDDMQRWNPGVDLNILDIGQKLCVIGSVSPTKIRQLERDCQKWFLVKQDDKCFQAARSERLKLAPFLEINPGVKCNELQIGQLLCVRRNAMFVLDDSAGAERGCSSFYEVRDGDGCQYIANGFGKTLDEFVKLNANISCAALQTGHDVCVN